MAAVSAARCLSSENRGQAVDSSVLEGRPGSWRSNAGSLASLAKTLQFLTAARSLGFYNRPCAAFLPETAAARRVCGSDEPLPDRLLAGPYP